jgi:hypothetical protein
MKELTLINLIEIIRSEKIIVPVHPVTGQKMTKRLRE